MCPFDLPALLPAPADILALGPDHPEARDWLQLHWGLRDRPRRVERRPDLEVKARHKRNHPANAADNVVAA